MSVKLIELTEQHITRQDIRLPGRKSFYPSEASVQWVDEHNIKRTDGTCLRQSWYRLSGKYQALEKTPYSERIFALGKAVEVWLVEQWKQMGIWVANNVKFYDEERDISGEVDCVLRDVSNNTLYAIEAKSFYGYNATKEICGNQSQPGRPKTNQMLQSLIYVDQGLKHGLWNYVKMVYMARDSGASAEFDISIVDDNGVKRPTVNGEIDWRFTMDDIYKRYAQLAVARQSETPPPRDFQRAWDAATVERLYALDEIGKTAYDKWKRSPSKNPVGSWHCSYCPFREVCYGEHKNIP